MFLFFVTLVRWILALFFVSSLTSHFCHQEELKIRREKEAEIIRQQEFLRNSLRASKQLRALADNLPVTGLVNEAYDEEGENIWHLESFFF